MEDTVIRNLSANKTNIKIFSYVLFMHILPKLSHLPDVFVAVAKFSEGKSETSSRLDGRYSSRIIIDFVSSDVSFSP
jgi:hypothetical protein